MRTVLVLLTTVSLLAGCGEDETAKKQLRITELKAQESSLSAQYTEALNKERELSNLIIPARNEMMRAKRDNDNVEVAKAAYEDAEQAYNEAREVMLGWKRKLDKVRAELRRLEGKRRR